MRDLAPLGIVPYDSFVLPLTSPDGSRAATHVGAAPPMRTLLAARGASPPEYTAVRLWSLASLGSGAAPRGAKGGATIAEPVVLGRATNDEGALVESPQPDGSRWIGLAPWSMKTGDPLRWLVSDDRVNAFAALGPHGALAWSRRSRGDTSFEVVVRPRGDSARELVLPREPGESWLLPSFSVDGSRLFALVLHDQSLEVAMIELGAEVDATFGLDATTGSGSAPGPTGTIESSELRGEIRREPIATGCTIETAWQCLAAQQAWPIEADRPADAFFYYHPQRRRLILWRAASRQSTALPAGSLAGAYLDESSLLLSFPTRTLVQSMAPIKDLAASSTPFAAAYQLLPKLYLPRATSVPAMPLLLLGPDRADVGVLGVVVGELTPRAAPPPPASAQEASDDGATGTEAPPSPSGAGEAGDGEETGGEETGGEETGEQP